MSAVGTEAVGRAVGAGRPGTRIDAGDLRQLAVAIATPSA